ncbi:hypothetical protein DITRI_Ditri01bG0176600 [Diplodiscus trichospermus]
MPVADSHMRLEPMLAGYAGYIFADFWGIDNNGDASTPFWFTKGLQGHQKRPWIITRRFVSIFAGRIMFSQQFHAGSHGTKNKLPPLLVALSDMLVYSVLLDIEKHEITEQEYISDPRLHNHAV